MAPDISLILSSIEQRVPKNLVEITSEGPRAFRCFPTWFNREARRQLLNDLPRRIRNVGNSDFAILLWLLLPSPRYENFWAFQKTIKRQGLTEALKRPFYSLDYYLLDSIRPRFPEVPIDESALRREIPILTELQAAIGERVDVPAATSAAALMAWIDLQPNLSNWGATSEDQRKKVVNAIFSLCGITDSQWFFEAAVAKAPGIVEYFLELPKAKEEPEGPPLAERWAKAWDGLMEVSRKAILSGPDSKIFEELDQSLSSVNGLRAVTAAPDQLVSGIRAIEAALKEVHSEAQFPEEHLIRQIVARWHSASRDIDDTSAAPAREDLARAVVQIKATAGELVEGQSQLSERLRKLGEIDSALAMNPDMTVRRQLHQERNRVDLERVQQQSRISECEQKLLDVASPFGAPFDWAVDYLKAGEPAPLEQFPSNSTQAPASVPPSSAVGTMPQVTSSAPVPVPLSETSSQREQSTTSAPSDVVLEPALDSNAPPQTEKTEAKGAESDPAITAPQSFAAPEAIETALWGAIGEDRVVLAYHLARAFDSDAWNNPVSPDLIKAACLANVIQSPDGSIGHELARAYANIDTSVLSFEDASASEGLNFLLVAACLYPSLIAPMTGASAMLRYRHLEGAPSLYSLCEMVIEYGERLQGLNPGLAAFRGVRNLASWQADLARLREEVGAWRGKAKEMTFLFAPATDVWRHWVREKGLLSDLLEAVNSEDPGRVEELRREIAELQDAGSFQDKVRHCDRTIIGRRRGDDIHARALTQLRERTKEVIAFLREWIEIIESRPQESDYVIRQLDEVRKKFRERTESVRRELGTLASRYGPSAAVVPGTKAVERTIDAFEMLFQPEARLREPEPEASILLAEPLLCISEIDLDDQWCPMQGYDSLKSVLFASITEECDIRSAFARRLARGDLDGARKIMTFVEAGDDLGATADQDFGSRFAAELEHHRSKLRTALTSTRSKVEEALAYGYISDDERAREDRELVSIEQRFNDILRFHVEQRRLDEIQGRVRAAKEIKVAEAQERLLRTGLDSHAESYIRIAEVLARGDVLTANEYLERVQAGQPIPSAEAAVEDSFSGFFPGAAAQIDEFLAVDTNAGRLPALLRNAEAFAGLAIHELSKVQAKSAAEMAEGWLGLRRLDRVTDESLRRVLTGLGFANVRLKLVDETRGRSQWNLDTEVIASRSVCRVPQYGSQAAGKYSLICISGRISPEDLLRWVPERHGGGRPAIVFYTGTLSVTQRRELARISRQGLRTMLVLDSVLLTYLCAEAGSRLAAFFSCSLPFTYIEPHITTSGLVPPEIFYGREAELNAVREPNGRCFIYGGRQLGKTALLRHAERSFMNPAEQRFAKWVDLRAEGIGITRTAEELWLVIHRVLGGLGIPSRDSAEPNLAKKGGIESYLDEIKKWFTENSERRFLLLLDEADKFLEQDARREYPETSRLKNLMEVTARRFKVVFAGLHNVLRTTEQANHPLAHLGEPINVGPLLAGESRTARSLLSEPIQAAGYEFDAPDLVVRILAQTNYYPSLIQLYGSELIRRLRELYSTPLASRSGPRYPITEKVVDETYLSRDLREAVRAKFHLTLQLDPRYEVIAYAMAYSVRGGRTRFEDGQEFGAIVRDVRSWWPEGFRNISDWALRVLLDEMVGLGVLRHVEETKYALRNPNILLLMGTDAEMDWTLLEKPRQLPEEFDPNTYRAHRRSEGTSHDRSPLTFLQESQIRRQENGVSVIAGSTAAGLLDVDGALVERLGTEFSIVLGKGVGKLEFHKALDTLDRRTRGGTTVMIVSCETRWQEDWIATAEARVTKLKAPDRFARVVFLADPLALASELPAMKRRGVEIIGLKPWAPSFVHQWLDDLGVGADRELIKQLAAVSGCWPAVLCRIAREVQGGWTGARFLDRARTLVAAPDVRASLAKDFGLEHAPAKAVVRLAADLGEFSETDFVAFADANSGVDPGKAAIWLQWAELIGLVFPSGDGWRADPLVASLAADR